MKIKSHFKLVYGVFSIEACAQANSYAFSKFIHSMRARCFNATQTLYKNTDLPNLSFPSANLSTTLIKSKKIIRCCTTNRPEQIDHVINSPRVVID